MKHRDIKNLLTVSNAEQIKKLERDKHKPDFTTHKLREILKMLHGEIAELNEAYALWANTMYLDTKLENIYLDNLMQEFADVSNLSDMGILKCKVLKGANK